MLRRCSGGRTTPPVNPCRSNYQLVAGHILPSKPPQQEGLYMRHLILPSLFLLTACAHDQQGIHTEVVTVEKEVMRPCAGTKPPRPEPLSRPLPTDPVALAALLGAKLAEYSAKGMWADKAEAIITRCTTP